MNKKSGGRWCRDRRMTAVLAATASLALPTAVCAKFTRARQMLLGAAATAVYAHARHEPLAIPAQAWVGGLAAALLIGALAGLLPAIRAARMSPTQALWSI